jgi:hypothetical protein
MSIAKTNLKQYLKASTQQSGVPLKVKDKNILRQIAAMIK